MARIVGVDGNDIDGNILVVSLECINRSRNASSLHKYKHNPCRAEPSPTKTRRRRMPPVESSPRREREVRAVVKSSLIN
jgi:hypothetical protein